MIRKIDLANEALEIAGLTSSSNSATPEMTQKALKALERSMLNLESSGVYIGYKAAENMFKVDGNADSGLADTVVDHVIKYIAIDICESLAAPFTGELKQQARRSYRKLLSVSPINRTQTNNVPSGAGNQRYGYGWRNNYMTPEKDKIDVQDDGTIDGVTI